MPGVRLLLSYWISVGWMRGRRGWVGAILEASPAAADGLTSTEAGGGRHGGGDGLLRAQRTAGGGLKMYAI